MRASRGGFVAKVVRESILVVMVFLLSALVQPCQAGMFFDDFNDGNTEGWIPAEPYPWVTGNWHVVDGVLVQDAGGDGHRFLVENYVVSNHSITTRLTCTDYAGYGGVVIWSQGYDNYIQVILYPDAGAIWIHERIDGKCPTTNSRTHIRPSNTDGHEIRVEADSGGTL